MGGNALKRYETTRLNRDDYFSLCKEFSHKFEEHFGFTPTLIKSYNNKTSFGDADYLLDKKSLPDNWTSKVKEVFSLDKEQMSKNGDVLSIGYKNFQIDLITVKDVDAAYFYFSYNDFGNLIGRLGHKLGIKIGHNGLSIIIRHKDLSDHILEEIHLSSNHKDILDILGLDFERYNEGFNDLEDIFNYVSSSKWFNRDIYLLENRNNTSKHRDRKRETYSKFLTWCNEKQPANNHEFSQKTEHGGYSLRMPYYEDIVLQRWPHVKSLIDDVISQFEFNQKFKTVFNGDIVTKNTGYTGKTLGAFMAKMKAEITDDMKKIWIERPYLVDLAISQKFLNLGGVKFRVNSST